MKYLIILLTFISLNMQAQNFHDIKIQSIDDKTINMSDYKGQYVLIVNVASKCGYTSQYTDLQTLSENHNNLVVLGVPCNQFGGQEPGSEEEIKTFCSSKFSVDFPMTEKIDVKGKDQHPLYQWLTNKDMNKKDDYKVSWNFNKFLVGKNGELIEYFGSGTSPLSDDITKNL